MATAVQALEERRWRTWRGGKGQGMEEYQRRIKDLKEQAIKEGEGSHEDEDERSGGEAGSWRDCCYEPESADG